MLSSCPTTPGLFREASELDADSKNQSENTLPSLRPLNNEYRLSNRKFRQLSPLEQKPTSNVSLTVDNTTEGFMNHAYSSESLYNQLPVDNSITSAPVPLLAETDSTSTPESITTNSTPSTPSTTITLSPSPYTPEPTILENFRHMCSVIRILMKNTRYVFIIIANLFEGILIKGKSCILL
jgi:hypothetical protein